MWARGTHWSLLVPPTLFSLFHVDYRQNEGALKHGNEGWREVAQHRWNGVTQHCDRGFLRAVPNFT